MDQWVSEVSPVRSGGDHTGMFKRQSAGRLGSPAGPAVSSSTGWFLGQCNSEPQLFICWFTGTLWSSCMINKLHSTVCILLMMHFPMQFISISEIICLTHAFAVSLLSLYLGEKFTHSPMSQSLRASDTLWCASCLLCFAFWSHGIIMNDDYTALLPKHGQHSSRNSVYERKVYKYSTGKFMFKMCLRKLALFCSQWQAEWFQVFCDTEQSSREASALRSS